MPRFYINTYQPLVVTKAGREASDKHNLPPFIDGSIRREPDLEHQFPGISCLCRGGRFAPRLRVGDVVAYITTRGRYRAHISHWRLTAILKVIEICVSHADAAAWYRKREMRLPGNCMVDGNPAQPLSHSHRRFQDCSHREWDVAYRARSIKFPKFVVCEVLCRNLSWEAPMVDNEDFEKCLGKRPGTQNPGALILDDLREFIATLGIKVRLSEAASSTV